MSKLQLRQLKRFPAINASIDGNDIIYHGYYDLGIAVSTARGLIVPVLHDADQLDFAGIEKCIADFGEKARAGTLTYDDLKGGTFTITNGGVFGNARQGFPRQPGLRAASVLAQISSMASRVFA